MPLYLHRLTETAVLPTRATGDSAGLDLYADEDAVIPEYSRTWVATGLALAIAPGYCGLIWPRSGLAGSGLDTSAGCIDSDYRGEVKILLVNGTPHRRTVRKGERIAQLLVLPIGMPSLLEVDSLPETQRGLNGFGSSGI